MNNGINTSSSSNTNYRSTSPLSEKLSAFLKEDLETLSRTPKEPDALWQGRSIKTVNSDEAPTHIPSAVPQKNLSALSPARNERDNTSNYANQVSSIFQYGDLDHQQDKSLIEQEHSKTNIVTLQKSQKAIKWECSVPGCGFKSPNKSNLTRHIKQHNTGVVNAYRCLAKDCKSVMLQTSNLLQHICKKEDSSHREFYETNKIAIHYGGSDERKKFISDSKCKAIRNNGHLTIYNNDQKLGATHSQLSEKAPKDEMIPQNRDSVIQETAAEREHSPTGSLSPRGSQSPFLTSALPAPNQLSNHEELQKVPVRLLSISFLLNPEIQVIDLQPDPKFSVKRADSQERHDGVKRQKTKELN